MAIYKRGREFELGTRKNKSGKWPERDSNPGPPDFESDALTTQPRCLPKMRMNTCIQSTMILLRAMKINLVMKMKIEAIIVHKVKR